MEKNDKKIGGIKKDTRSTQEILASLYTMLAPNEDEENETDKSRYNASTRTLYAKLEEKEE